MANRIPAISFILLLLILCVSVRRSEAIDCRRFVFAPMCRGVSAKRAQIPPLDIGDLRRSNRLRINAKRNSEEMSDEQADYDSYKTPDFLRSLMQEYWGHRDASNDIEA